MNAPTGLIFAMRSRYVDGTNADRRLGTEALFNEPDSAFAGQSSSFSQTDGFVNGALVLVAPLRLVLTQVL